MFQPPQIPSSELKSSNLLSMFQRKITHPSAMQLKILIQIQDNIPRLHRPQDDFKLATITIYTENAVYQGRLTGKCIIRQLAWTTESMNTLLDCLKGGKRDSNNKVETRFFPHQNQDRQKIYIYENICEISSGINLPLFTVQMHQSQIANPFMHMRQKFSALERTFRERQAGYKEKEEQLKAQLNEIQAVEKQIIYSSSTEIGLMKKEFIKHVNKQKAKIRKLMGSVPMINPVSGMIENRGLSVGGKDNKSLARIPQKQQYEEEQQRTQSMKKPRLMMQVNRQKYNWPQPQKLQIQESSSQSQQKYFSENSSLSSRQQQNPKRQKPHGQKRKHRFAQDYDSSDQDSDNGKGEGYGEEKTFLELQRERLQRQKMLNGEGKENQEEGDVWDNLVI